MTQASSSDTSAEADRVQFELFEKMSPSERAARMTGITLAVQQLAFSGMKVRHPNASDDELWLRLAAKRLGPELVKKIYGFDPEQC
ncbi:MAG TPA: hypothetical protein VHL58_11240 [Thermoanaerobaculia bacterium]|nr:hypothetical protein [Thermoanaerobaculia bacterium]